MSRPPPPRPSRRPTLVYTIHVDAPPAEVWRAIVDPDLTHRYFYGLFVRSTFRPGARIVFETPAGEPHMTGTVVELRPRSRLVVRARILKDEDTAADAPSRITWEIEPVAGGCRLTVVHDEFEGETASYGVVKQAWPTVVEGLRELMETGDVQRAREAWPETARERLESEP